MMFKMKFNGTHTMQGTRCSSCGPHLYRTVPGNWEHARRTVEDILEPLLRYQVGSSFHELERAARPNFFRSTCSVIPR